MSTLNCSLPFLFRNPKPPISLLYSPDKNKTGASQVLDVLLFVFVSDPPRIDPLPPVRAQVPGETLVLNCTARGGPEPTITWYKDREFLHRGQTLVITNMTSERHELYSCRASNGIEPDDIVSVTVTSLGM